VREQDDQKARGGRGRCEGGMESTPRPEDIPRWESPSGAMAVPSPPAQMTTFMQRTIMENDK
jgi:hypothetical protein